MEVFFFVLILLILLIFYNNNFGMTGGDVYLAIIVAKS